MEVVAGSLWTGFWSWLPWSHDTGRLVASPARLCFGRYPEYDDCHNAGFVLADIKKCHAGSRHWLHASSWLRQKTVIWTGGESRERGKYRIMDCNIYQGSCNDSLNHHLRIDANTKPSLGPPADTSVNVSVYPASLLGHANIIQIEIWFQRIVVEDGGGNQVSQYWWRE